jgi:hypothetical protein
LFKLVVYAILCGCTCISLRRIMVVNTIHKDL